MEVWMGDVRQAVILADLTARVAVLERITALLVALDAVRDADPDARLLRVTETLRAAMDRAGPQGDPEAWRRLDGEVDALAERARRMLAAMRG